MNGHLIVKLAEFYTSLKIFLTTEWAKLNEKEKSIITEVAVIVPASAGLLLSAFWFFIFLSNLELFKSLASMSVMLNMIGLSWTLFLALTFRLFHNFLRRYISA